MSKADSQKRSNIFPRSWHLLIVIVLIIGIFFRLINIDKKVYWIDETFTLLRISGYTQNEVSEEVFNGGIITAEELQKKYQNVVDEKKSIHMFQSLSREDTHPPLYFILARWWFQFFNPWLTSVTAIRSFSVFISLLVFPALYWLCMELFNLSFIGYIALTIVAVSPIDVLYAQEARMYILWILLTVLSSAALLRAMRLNKKSSWLIYSLTVTLSLYTYLFSVLVAIGHGIYVLIDRKFRLTKKTIFYLVSSLLAGLLYLPWIFMLFLNWDKFTQITSWIEGDKSNILSLLTISFNNISNSLIDFWFIYTYFPNLNIPNFRLGIFIKPLLLILIVYSIYFVCRQTQQRVWLFILTLIGTTPLILLLRDLTAGSGSMTQARYLMPCYLGIQISLAYLLGKKCLNSRRIKLWRVITILLISGGLLSISISSQANAWSNKYNSNQHQIATVINKATNPLVISDSYVVSVLSLSHHLNSEIPLLLLKTPQQLDTSKLKISSNTKQDIFLFNPSRKLLQSFKKHANYQVVPVKEIRGGSMSFLKVEFNQALPIIKD